ncbi:vascular endothelial growth factor receptor 1 isoform X3 [Sitophilus oryzae]|uniref:receptor protein-tyrosine kinase n=1 Tax=Sitophilus oryzae TaxID=7048 RepID=A0A6J2XW35_SITOR|nr:vascular endothelial growth factor receptor 1 isoform X3 [Sitophilus oryzae]
MESKCALLVYLLGLGCISHGFSIKPKILERPETTEDIIIDTGSNYNLTCQGNRPLQWTYPHMNNAAKIQESGTIINIITSTVPQNDVYFYRSFLDISNMSYMMVGYYTCSYEDEEYSDSDQIYLYVNDPNHLSVDDSNYITHYAVQYTETVIPCKPTAPDVSVNLTNGDKHLKSGSFDPRRGFVVSDVDEMEILICLFFRGTKSERNVVLLSIEPPRTSLAKPYIEDVSKNHTEVGDTLMIKCYLKEKAVRNLFFKWDTPDRRDFPSGQVRKENMDGANYLVQTLTLPNASTRDSGWYSCTVTDKQNNMNTNRTYIHVQEKNVCFIDIIEQNDQRNISVYRGEDVQWVVKVNAHPIPTLHWYDVRNREIKNNTQYVISYLHDSILFKIQNASLENDGVYKIVGTSSKNDYGNECSQTSELQLILNVESAPSVIFKSQNVFLQNEPAVFNCTGIGNPIPKITWIYKKCHRCQEETIDYQVDKVFWGFRKFSSITILPVDGASVTCSADNSNGSQEESVQIYTSDIKDGFHIYNYDDSSIINENDEFTQVIVATNYPLKFTCAVSPKKSTDVQIYHDDNILTPDEKYNVSVLQEDMSTKITVFLPQSSENDGGLYSCQIRNKAGKMEYKNVTFAVKDPEQPRIIDTNVNDIINITFPGKPHQLYCNYTGIPKVSVEWYNGTNAIHETERVIFEENMSVLRFLSTEVTDENQYTCKISNDLGVDSRVGMLVFDMKPTSLTVYYYIIGIVLVCLLIAIIYIIFRIKKDKELKRKLKSLGLENFHKGNPEQLNPEIGIGDQAELLPYDKKWEVSFDQLKLGKQLGSGAFGVVVKAEAKKLIPGEEKSIVAVKMVKKNADETYIRALASELKIMVHLGKHVNVVNLLGACTKNVANKELLVIVEFCRYGNLQNYLFKHRESFINQVDHTTGKVDYNIGSHVLDRMYSISSDNGSTITTPYSMQDYREKERNGALNSATTQVTSLGEDQVTLSNNSIQPEWRTNYRGDYRGNVKPVCTKDLLTWSFQIARGMEYLASRKVMHGDLAARNILLADNNIVKICDFGLAKTMYKDNNYKKKGNSPLPLKWMAIESIRDRVFSTQSDVWSFGVVLWELFSLARTPYPGMEADERLYHKLVEGYRMEPPMYAPREMYSMMEDCWQSKPLARPTFTALTERIGYLLEESVRKHYVDLNDPYLAMNTHQLEDTDYLAMLSPPSFDQLSAPSPHYVNEGQAFPIQESQELHPMLHSNNESDSESGYLKPITPINSISNPMYHLPPQNLHHNGLSSYDRKEPLKTPDNYINMPQYKNIVAKNGSERSPIPMDVIRNNDSVQYVNSDAQLWDSVDV